MGGALTNPATVMPMGGPVRTGLTALGSVFGGQAGSELGEKVGGPVGGVVGGLAGGAAGGIAAGGTRGPPTSARTNIPKQAENPTVDAAMKAARGFGIEPSAGAATGSRVISDFERFGGGKAVLEPERQLTSAAADLMGARGANISDDMLAANKRPCARRFRTLR